MFCVTKPVKLMAAVHKTDKNKTEITRTLRKGFISTFATKISYFWIEHLILG